MATGPLPETGGVAPRYSFFGLLSTASLAVRDIPTARAFLSVWTRLADLAETDADREAIARFSDMAEKARLAIAQEEQP